MNCLLGMKGLGKGDDSSDDVVDAIPGLVDSSFVFGFFCWGVYGLAASVGDCPKRDSTW